MRLEVETNLYDSQALQRKFSGIDTQFSVTLGKISAIISDSEIEEYQDGHTTMHSRLLSIKSDLDGTKESVSDMKTTYDNGFTTIQSRITQFDRTLDGITASVSSVSGGVIVNDTLHFLATDKSSDVTISASGWTDSFQALSTSKPNLWIYHTYTYNSGAAYNSSPSLIATYQEGKPLTGVTSIYYVTGVTTPPNKPSAKITNTSKVYNAWTTTIADATDEFKYLYTSEQLEYGNAAEWTNVVCNNSFADLTNRVSKAEQKITDKAIVQTVRSSQDYTNDLASKNASYTGDYVPTNSNLPASGWTTDEDKAKHLNDTFMSNSGKIYQYVQGSYGLRITFSNDSRTEATRYDYVRIYYQKDGKTYALPDIGGTDIANASVFVPTNAFWLYWKTDGSQQYYGFRIVDVEWVFNSHPTVTESSLPSIAATDTSGTDYPETTHPYTGNEEKMWKYTTSYTPTPTFTYGWVEIEDPSVRTLEERMSSAELKITADAIVSTVTDSSFGDLVTSTIYQDGEDIWLKAKYVSWDSTYSSMTKDGKLKCTGAEITGIITTIGDEER